MAKQVSDRIPDFVVNFAVKASGSVSAFGEDCGHADNWVIGMFQDGQPNLSKYARIADAAGKSIEHLVDRIESRTMSGFIDDLIHSIDSIDSKAGLARYCAVSKPFINMLYKDDGKLHGLSSYVELARRVGEPVDRLRMRSVGQPGIISA